MNYYPAHGLGTGTSLFGSMYIWGTAGTATPSTQPTIATETESIMRIVRTQVSGDINLVVSLATSLGAPDTGASLSFKYINPNGTENTTATAPSVAEVIPSSGVYRLTFASGAVTPLFTLADQNNPYTILVTSTTLNSTWYRAFPVYVTSKMFGDLAKSTETTALATQASIDLLAQYAHNKKILEKNSSTGEWFVTIRNADDTGNLLKRGLKDKTGADITDLAAGVIAQELKAV
jgi:hypothetical protein